MGRLLQAELIKLRTTRTFIALIAVGVVLSLAIVILQAFFLDPGPDGAVEVVSGDASSLFVLILGIVGITGEWRHRTITSSLLAAPLRWRFLLAKVLAYAVTGLVVSLLVTVLTAAVGSLVLSLRDQPLPSMGDLVDLGWRNLLVAGIFGAFGVGLGGLIRNQPVAIVVVLIDFFVVENLLIGLVPSVGKFAPLVGLSAPLIEIGQSSPDDGDLFAFAPALGLFAVWIVVVVGLAGVLLTRRDVDG